MVSLSKNQSVSLSKTTDSILSNIDIGLGWDPIKQEKKGFFSAIFSGASESIDLDASVVLLDSNGKELDIIYFGNIESNCGSVVHQGDNLTGEGDGDDEIIKVNLTNLPEKVKFIAITVNSFRGQTFNEVDNAHCRILDAKTNKELANYKLAEQGPHTGIIIASLTRETSDWTFTALGRPSSGRTVRDMLADIRLAVL